MRVPRRTIANAGASSIQNRQFVRAVVQIHWMSNSKHSQKKDKFSSVTTLRSPDLTVQIPGMAMKVPTMAPQKEMLTSRRLLDVIQFNFTEKLNFKPTSQETALNTSGDQNQQPCTLGQSRKLESFQCSIAIFGLLSFDGKYFSY